MVSKKWWAPGLCAVSCLLSAAVWADEPSDAAMRADIEVLKAKLARLESQMSAAPSGGTSGIGEKPAGALVELPSGLQGLGMSGFVDTSFSYNFAEPAPTVSRGNRGRVFDTEPEGFTIHAAEVVLEKPITDEMPLGFRADLFFGDDAEVIHSTGLGNGGSPTDSFDLQQAYITGKIPVGEGIDLKVGKFVTLLGAEVIESPANWNFSRSYLFGFAIPFTHTGALLTYPLGELGSVTGGVVNGWDVADDNNKGKALLGNITLTPMEGLTLATNVITGAERSGHNRSVVDLVATWQATEQLAVMANYDYGHESNLTQGVSGVAGYDGANWQGIALYAKYDMTPVWSLAGRWEWFDDKDSVRLALTGPDGATLDDVDYYEWTLTSQWKLREHVLARLEYRHDKADERVFFQDADGFTNRHDTVAAELIYHF